ncbi:MAG: type II toxin-antitoxin system RelE/ParE family toxin [Candidatus Sericytochromatia bacterium]|nr:type II toxin-antitoxin system RelE/ParE family toxin [Candidatus Tanganyikabacteria bacterium]
MPEFGREDLREFTIRGYRLVYRILRNRVEVLIARL